jgi:hypothetical protein
MVAFIIVHCVKGWLEAVVYYKFMSINVEFNILTINSLKKANSLKNEDAKPQV